MIRGIQEVIISVEKGVTEERKLIHFSARNVVTGKIQSELTLYGDENELHELLERLKKRIEDALLK